MRSIRIFAVAGAICATLVLPMPAVGEDTLAPMIARVVPAVVSISSEADQSGDRPTLPDAEGSSSIGSGSIIDAAKGLILTDCHVVDGAEAITVTLSDGRSFEAQVVGKDVDSDIAVIKIDADGLTELPIGDSNRLRVGDYVVAVGNPFGLSHTVTHGIVSALGRTGFETGAYEGYIQTDAAINPGNSGGPLVDLDGNMVGVNSAIIDSSGGSSGIGFAIPSTVAKQILQDLIAHGQVRRGRLGVVSQDLTADLAAALHAGTSKGAVVSQVLPGSAAEIAGLAAGDVIVGINGQGVADSGELRRLIGNLAPETNVRVTLLRDGRQLDRNATVTLKTSEPATYDGTGLLRSVVMARVASGSPAYGKVQGAVVVSVDADSAAAIGGLAEGDVIATVDRQPVAGPKQVVTAAAKDQDLLLLGIYRDEQMHFVVVRRPGN